MASQEHLDILKQGVEIWNKWRKEHADITPNLSKADLSGANLEEADLSGANLHEANLHHTNLSKAHLSEADLIEADLRRANLHHTNLSGAWLNLAKLGWANLRGANLHKARLRQADFSFSGRHFLDKVPYELKITDYSPAQLSGADLSDADLYGAELCQVALDGADLRGADLTDADLRRANLNKAILNNTCLREADLRGAHLEEADFGGANLSGADLSRADLSRASLSRASLSEANLSRASLLGADLSEADLDGAILVETALTRANLTQCSVYGISAWNVKLEGAIQDRLVITPDDEPTITVDNLKIAQFIYLLLNNKEIRDVIDTITSKVVLILGRFTEERKQVLDALREELRKRNYLPVLFDFEKPANRDLTETVSTLAHLARFILVDLTDPSSAPHEVATVIPQTVVPVQPLLTLQPLIVDGKAVERHEYAMFEDLRRRYPWVLPTFRYQDTADLLASLQKHVIKPAELKAQELEKR